jgi:cytochrome c556
MSSDSSEALLDVAQLIANIESGQKVSRLPPAYTQAPTAAQDDIRDELAEAKKKCTELERKVKETAKALATDTKRAEELQGELSDACEVCSMAVEKELKIAERAAKLEGELRAETTAR